MSLALFVSYAFVAIFVTVIFVLFCLSCQCSVPLRKIWLWLFNMRCCKCPQRTEVEEKRVAKSENKQARSTESDYERCFAWVPFVLTCGYCWGALREEESRLSTAPTRLTPSVVAQPVSESADEIAGVDMVVAVRMPLLPL